MDGVSEEQQTFEAMKAGLVGSHPGEFAVICGSRLLGIFKSIDDALLASSREFDAEQLPEGRPVLISEIAELVSVRVTARPYVRQRAAVSPPC